jgi:hypothetical protein
VAGTKRYEALIQQQLTQAQQGGKQGDMKNLGEANEAAMAQVAKEQ